VVVKAHPGHMATAELTAQAIVRAVEKAALPAGVFNMIFGTDIGAELVRHPAIQAVGFTGSLRGGRRSGSLRSSVRSRSRSLRKCRPLTH
jgi:NADP-dependent aldehyde dehydrogenase